MGLTEAAMLFAMQKHANQVRKYTNDSYTSHLAEVAGIAASVGSYHDVHFSVVIATSWLHDCVEDQGVSHQELLDNFGHEVAYGVLCLSDLETGNRKTRKELSCARLAKAEGWIQTIKCADLISNTKSIVTHDKDFATVYLKEKRNLLSVLTKADRTLWHIASTLANQQV